MNNNFSNYTKNRNLNTINKLSSAHIVPSKININIKFLTDFAVGTVMSGIISLNTHSNKILFEAEEGQFILNNIISDTDNIIAFNDNDQLTIQIIQWQNTIVADIISLNNKSVQGILSDQKITGNYTNTVLNNNRLDQFMLNDDVDIISIQPHNSLEQGARIDFSIINLDKIKLNNMIDSLLQTVNQMMNQTVDQAAYNLDSDETLQVNSLESYFKQNIDLKQLTILIDKLSKISDNSLLQGALLAIDNDSMLAEEVSIQNNKLVLQITLSNAHDEQIMLSNFATFKAQLYIPIHKKFIPMALELTDIINDEYEDNIQHLDDLSKFFKTDFNWLSLEDAISLDNQKLTQHLASAKLPIAALDEFMLAKLVSYEQHVRQNSLAAALDKINIDQDMFKTSDNLINNLSLDFLLNSSLELSDNSMINSLTKVSSESSLSKDLANIASVNEYLLSHSANAWQFMILPLFNGQKLQYLKIFTRQEDASQSNKKRFILEIYSNLTGNMQLDGILTNNIDTGHCDQFNLIVRSRIALSQADSTIINAIFKSNQQLFNIKGFIKFEQAAHFNHNPANDILNMLLIRDRKSI